MLLSCNHILQHYLALFHFIFSDKDHIRYGLGVGIPHLLLHLCRIRINLCPYALLAHFADNGQTISGLFLTEVDEQHLGSIQSLFGIEFKGIQYIINTVCSKRDAYTAQSWHTEDAGKIVIAATTRNTSHGGIKRLHLEDCSCIIVQATGKRKIKLNLIGKSHLLERIQNKAGFLYAFKSSLRSGKHLCDGLQFIIVGTLKANDRLQLLNGLFANTASSKLVVDIIQPYLVQLVYCNRNINNLVSFAYYLSDTGKNLTVVNLDLNANAESAEDGIDNLHQFYLIEQRIRANNISIALEELAITSLLRTVSAPHWLNLIALERQLKFISMHDHITRKWNGKVITQPFLAQLCSQMKTIAPSQFFIGNLAKIIARVEHLEQEFVAFLSILTHQGLESLHCRSFNLLESIKRIYLANGIKDIVALRHFYRAEISRPLGYRRFLCHLFSYYCLFTIRTY